MKTPSLTFHWFGLAVAAWLAVFPSLGQTQLATGSAANKSVPIPRNQLAAVTGKQYQGDGLSVAASASGAGAWLRCVFQGLEGQVTSEGLWLCSAADGSSGERFRVRAVSVGRADDFGFGNRFRRGAVPGHSKVESKGGVDFSGASAMFTLPRPGTGALRETGNVSVTHNVAQFIRDGLTEEYSVSMDGVRQDFIIEQPPDGGGELCVELEVNGAKADPVLNGARLVLDGSGHKLAYSRLHVVDARGQILTARLELTDMMRLAVVVDDAAAVYPVRIDPTFSDADWTSMGGIPGADNVVYAAVFDGFGNLYIGGSFTVAGENIANRIAKWNGNTWSTLGSGMNGTVYSLAVSENDLYAGGTFTMAGGNAADFVAKWDGSSWSALGSGMDNRVSALAVSGSNGYAGGFFTTAGGTPASFIAKWDGISWSGLGSGMGDDPTYSDVRSLAVSGSNLYAGGAFKSAGGVVANYIARWHGNSWSALGSGLSYDFYGVLSLAVSGSDVYAGGAFKVAKWNGSTWTDLVSAVGMAYPVEALALVGTDLYAGGLFATVNGTIVNFIAKWNGSSWSSLASGMNNDVYALAVSGSELYGGAGSQLRAATSPTESPSRTGAVGRRWVWATTEA